MSDTAASSSQCCCMTHGGISEPVSHLEVAGKIAVPHMVSGIFTGYCSLLCVLLPLPQHCLSVGARPRLCMTCFFLPSWS